MVFIPLVLLFAYILYNNYKNSYNQSTDDALKYLSGVSNSLSIAIDGDLHQKITDRYTKKDEIHTNAQDSCYLQLQEILSKAYHKNDFKTSIYTIFFDSLSNQFFFGVSSSDHPFYRHSYKQFPELLKKNYATGSVISEYEDEHGKWLSAFAPIKNKNGKTVAVVQADIQFDIFQTSINRQLTEELLISLFIIFISMAIMYRFIDRVLESEAKSKAIIESQNKDINQSLDYAKLILDATMKNPSEIKKYFPELFVFFRPKFTVGGDFYFFCPVVETENILPTKYYLGVFDCTGHGIPGSILSMLGMGALNEIVKDNLNQSPNIILNKLNEHFIKTLHQSTSENSVQDGMEGCLCLIDTKNMTFEMAGAKKNCYFIENEKPHQIKEIIGSKFPIGGSHYELKRNFNLVKFNLNQGDKLILCSDGIVDQFSDNKVKSKKYGNKRLKEIFTQKEFLNFTQLCNHFCEDFTQWKGNSEQTDDATLIALSVSKSKAAALKVA